VQGQFLQMISRMIKPLKVLEIGTFTGFSALCLAVGLTAERDHYTLSSFGKKMQRRLFNISIKASITERIYFACGQCQRDHYRHMKEEWDLVFIDADKMSYIDYYELTLPAVEIPADLSWH
jgi:caffeoyl-CoA O-methyltransferase